MLDARNTECNLCRVSGFTNKKNIKTNLTRLFQHIIFKLNSKMTSEEYNYPYQKPSETEAAFHFLLENTATGEDIVRQEEAWSEKSENLLKAWAKEWHCRTNLHENSRLFWKRISYILGIPNATIPLVAAAIWEKIPTDEKDTIATVTFGFCGALSALVNMLKAAEVSTEHHHAQKMYQDLLSDVETILSQERAYRPDVDVTVQSFKMRSDSLLHCSPPVHFVNRTIE